MEDIYMTDREKLLLILDAYKNMDSIGAILNCFLDIYGDNINIRTLSRMLKELHGYLDYRIDKLETARFVANERAGYIKKYLEGKMWPTEELARQYLQPQIDNAQDIIDACKCK
jgi:hypothetical protein